MLPFDGEVRAPSMQRGDHAAAAASLRSVQSLTICSASAARSSKSRESAFDARRYSSAPRYSPANTSLRGAFVGRRLPGAWSPDASAEARQFSSSEPDPRDEPQHRRSGEHSQPIFVPPFS